MSYEIPCHVPSVIYLLLSNFPYHFSKVKCQARLFPHSKLQIFTPISNKFQNRSLHKHIYILKYPDHF
jgi:hypothetical protein